MPSIPSLAEVFRKGRLLVSVIDKGQISEEEHPSRRVGECARDQMDGTAVAEASADFQEVRNDGDAGMHATPGLVESQSDHQSCHGIGHLHESELGQRPAQHACVQGEQCQDGEHFQDWSS